MKLHCSLIAVLCYCTTANAGDLSVFSNFEGGSAQVESIDQQRRRVTIRPAGDPQFGWPCWWYFRLEGIEPGETVSVEVLADQMKKSNGMKLSPRWALPDRAAFSTDQKTWQQTEPGEGDEHHSIWSVKIDSTTAWFAWGPPFVPTDAVALVDRLAKATPHATAFQLCRTRAGRTVPALIVTENGEDNGKRPVIWVQARQHAWESGGSWVGRGFAEWLTGDSPRAAALRQKAVVYYVPIMDIDNTATGNGGKEQVPYDHNRAWFAETQFNAVRVAMQRLSEIDHQKRLVLFVDLHNPGSGATRPYFFVAPPELVSPQRFAQQERFIKACREEITDPWPLDEKLPVTGPKYDPLWKRMSANWIKQNTQQYVVGLTLETAWNTPHSHAAGYQSIGRRLGLSMELYLRMDPRDSVPVER